MSKRLQPDTELLESFVDDATEALQAFEIAVCALRSGRSQETLQELFCIAHNLKGASMCIGIESFADFVHEVEDVIQCLINGAVVKDERVVEILVAVQQCMMTWVRGLISNPSHVPPTESLRQDLFSLRRGESALEGEMPRTIDESIQESKVDESADEEDLEALFQMHKKIYEEGQRARDERAVANSKSADGGAVPQSTEPDALPAAKTKSGKGAPRLHETLRISAQKLDELVQLISELSVHQGILQEAGRGDEIPSQAASHALQLTSKLVKEIHSKALELRMQPLSALMQKLEKTATDLATMQGKLLRVVIEGSEVQFDKTVIEKISDPLVHVIRNSVDHGIEPPVDRVAAGKNPEANLRIAAVQDAGGVSIVVSDDGRGMDDKAILAAAIRKGVVAPEAQLSSEQIKNLIFVQGISTAPRLTEISGRGVGMDIVMRTAQSLRGQIGLRSVLGEGTSITMTLPTSMSIVDALVVGVRDTRYAIPMSELTEIIDLGSYPIEATGKGGAIISLRGEVIPIEALANYMPTTESEPNHTDTKVSRSGHRCPALLVRDGAQSVAFAIDQILSQQQVVVRPLSEQLDGLRGLRGFTILGDGEPGVILSLPELARSYFSSVGGK
jgi:two-component system, chemotaxis family, sensor kinase CheA